MLMKIRTYHLLLLFVLSSSAISAKNENSLQDTVWLSHQLQQIDGAELTKVKDVNFLNSLIGRMAGATINSSASGIGGPVRFVMRGYHSIMKSNNVLFTLDGVPLPRLESEQPFDMYNGVGLTGDGIAAFSADDIENVSVLSSAAASALYGSRSSGGVMLISTKRAQAGKLRIELGNSTTFSSPLVMPEFQRDYAMMWGDKFNNPQSWNPADFFRTGHIINNSLSLSLGNEYNQTRVATTVMNGAGMIHNNDVDRYNFSLRNTSSLLKHKLKLDVNLRYIHTAEQNMLSQGMYGNPLVPIYLIPDVLQKQPNSPSFPSYDSTFDYPYKNYYEYYDQELGGNRQYWPFGDLGYGMQNPYWIINRNMYNQEKNRWLGGVGAKYDLASWLNVAVRVHYDRNKEVDTQKLYATTIYAGPLGSYYEAESKNTQLYADLLLNARQVIGDFSIDATLGASISDTKFDYTKKGGALAELNTFDVSKLKEYDAKLPSLQRDCHHWNRALFMLAQLGYKNRLSLDLGGRMEWFKFWDDHTPRFSTDVFYPSAGVSVIPTGWLSADADRFLSFLKLHYMYSESGNAEYIFLNKKPIWLNPSLVDDYQEPEHTKSHEVGFDASFLQDKVYLAFTMYKASTSDLKYGCDVRLPSNQGYTYYMSDGVRIDNKGIELTLGANLNFGQVKWNGRLTYTINKNEVKQLESNENEGLRLEEVVMSSGYGWQMSMKKGGSVGDIYVRDLLRDKQGNIIVDKKAQNIIPSNDYVYAGNADPNYTMGLTNSFSWKGLELDFVIHARFGGVGVSLTQAMMDQFGMSKATAIARDNGGVWVNGQQIPAKNYYLEVGQSRVGSVYTYDATNIRLAEMSIAYHIPVRRWVNWIQDVRVALVGRNLLMLYNKAPFDPESTASTGTWYQGIDSFRQPSSRNMGFSVNLTF